MVRSKIESIFTARIRRIMRMGKVMFSVCPHLGGGYPHPIMLCNISQNAMGQPGGYPARSSWGGTLPGPAGGVPCRGVPCQGGTLPGRARGGTLLGGYPSRVPPQQGNPPTGYPPGRVPPWQGAPRQGTPQPGQGGYPHRTTERVFTTWRAVCLLRSRRRTFLLYIKIIYIYIFLPIRTASIGITLLKSIFDKKEEEPPQASSETNAPKCHSKKIKINHCKEWPINLGYVARKTWQKILPFEITWK